MRSIAWPPTISGRPPLCPLPGRSLTKRGWMDGFNKRNLLLKLTCCSRPDPLWLGALLILLQISTSIRTSYVQKSLLLINLWKTIKSAFDCLWQKHKRRTFRLRTSRHESEREIWPHWTLLQLLLLRAPFFRTFNNELQCRCRYFWHWTLDDARTVVVDARFYYRLHTRIFL